MKQTRADKVKLFIKESKGSKSPFPEEALEDLKVFAAEAKKGNVASARAIERFIRTEYDLKISRASIHREMRQLGLTPWWNP